VEALTFGLAYAAFVLLCVTVGVAARARPVRVPAVATAIVAMAHVALVWHTRYGWSLDAARAGGWAPFLIFHAALVAIVAAAAAPEPWSRRFLYAAFPIVVFGATGAVLRREVVAAYRWPVIAAAAATILFAMSSAEFRSQFRRARR
jgi:hypothetical protein